MITYEQALETMLAQAGPGEPVRRPLEQCVGLTLAKSIAAEGRAVLSSGAELTPARLAAAAAAGATDPWVYPPPRVGLVSETGAPALAAAIRRSGAAVEIEGAAGEEPGAVEHSLADLLTRSDLIVVLRSARVERGDPLPEAIGRLGGKTWFDRVAIEPGGQVLFATVEEPTDRRYFLVLPGDPAAAIVDWLMFGLVIVGRLMGRQAERVRPPIILAMSDGALPATGHCMALAPGRLRPDEKFASWRVEPAGPFQGSPADVVALAQANALIVRPANAGALSARAVCDVLTLDGLLTGLT